MYLWEFFESPEDPLPSEELEEATVVACLRASLYYVLGCEKLWSFPGGLKYLGPHCSGTRPHNFDSLAYEN